MRAKPVLNLILCCHSFHSLALHSALPIHHSKAKGIKHLSKPAHFTQQEKDTFRLHVLSDSESGQMRSFSCKIMHSFQNEYTARRYTEVHHAQWFTFCEIHTNTQRIYLASCRNHRKTFVVNLSSYHCLNSSFPQSICTISIRSLCESSATDFHLISYATSSFQLTIPPLRPVNFLHLSC